jgi:hypothetical protein
MSDVIDLPAKSDIHVAFESLPAPIEIDPLGAAYATPDAPTCEQCGCVIEDLEALIYLRAADLIAQWELADPRDAWRHTGEQPPRVVDAPPAAQPYRTPQSTIDAFMFVARNHDAAYLALAR